MLSAPGDSGPTSSNAEFIQGLAAKSLETVRLTEELGVSPEDTAARVALSEHLSDLRRSARERGLTHLEAALAEALSRLEQDAFEPAALPGLRVLAWRYETLAAMPSQSGTHQVVQEVGLSAPGLSLRGRRVLVADPDAEARWLRVGVLREAGARVIEARDGVHALQLVHNSVPDLVLAAATMPRLDGLGLCAAFRREPELDGVPVVVLSGRTSAEEILDRVSRALEPMVALDQWLRSDREASGDLEELGVSGLLRAVRRLRPDAAMVLQDTWSLFDLALHDGRIVAVTRTAIDGAVTRGAEAFPPLVGMSSGRFVVAAPSEPERRQRLESLDRAFAQATRRLGILLSTMASHSDCHIELDQRVLATCVRHSPVAVQRLIERLVAGESPNALWESGAGSRGLVDALLVTLARQGAVRDVTVPSAEPDGSSAEEARLSPGRALIASENQQDSPNMADPSERENVRAQSAVAMHREPANPAPNWGHAIWRLGAIASVVDDESDLGFELEVQRKPRLLGLAFVMLLGATVALLLWRQLVPEAISTTRSAEVQAPTTPDSEPVEVSPAAPTEVAPQAGVNAFSGALREGVDPALDVAAGQGVLELLGPREVSVEVDGMDRGALPVTLGLDQGTHAVRYRSGGRSTDRFYYVKAGATRGLRVVTQAGGFVDAR